MKQGELVAVKLTDLESAAQQVHQGYHTDMGCSWRECPRNVCTLFRYMVENALPVLPTACLTDGG